MLNVIEESRREFVAVRVKRKLKAVDVIDVLSDFFIVRGMLGTPYENSYCESFNSKLRDELLNGEIFNTLMGEVEKQSIQ
jgi:putative transposase